MGEEVSKKREFEAAILVKASEVISTIKNAKHVDQVICALNSIATLLFPIDSSHISGSIDESYGDQVLGVKVHSAEERADWWQAFYHGIAFPKFARFLLLDFAPNLLACFPFSSKKHVYDVFFVHGLIPEVVQILALSLQHNGSDSPDINAVLSNSESLFFRKIIIQILSLAEERDMILQNRVEFGEKDSNGTLIFVGELFTRICRSGSADLLSSEVIPRVLSHVQSCVLRNDSLTEELLESNPDSIFWLRTMEAIRDPYTVERMSEQILHQLASQHANDILAYRLRKNLCKQHLLSSKLVSFFSMQQSLNCRSGKTLFQYDINPFPIYYSNHFIWFPLIYASDISAALGLSLETMTTEELDGTKDVMHLILQGVSCNYIYL